MATAVSIGKKSKVVPVEEQHETESNDERGVCVVCYEQPFGEPLRPCGHQHFCTACSLRFRRCPLCREPLLMTALPRTDAPETNSTGSGTSQNLILSKLEQKAFIMLIVFAWTFIWLGSFSEWNYDVPLGFNSTRCERGGRQKGCSECKAEYINPGRKCFEYLEDLPAVKIGASLGTTFYFVLIVATQAFGAACEIMLILRVHRRQMLPKKELLVLGIALLIEIVRMLLVDFFVLQDYFSGSSYRIFRAPIACSNSTWSGADGSFYCDDPAARNASTEYFIATHQSAFTANTAMCSTFTASSPLLDYGPRAEAWTFQFWPGNGHPRFARLGWVLGGEFAFYYFFATFVNEVADNFFVIPTTTSIGWKCKVFAIALELFQLGALCPAAIFTHGDCLHYTNPLGVPLQWISNLIVGFGYSIAVMPFFALPLAAAGLLIIGVLGFSGILLYLSRAACLGQSESAERWCSSIEARFNGYYRVYTKSVASITSAILMLAFVPLLLTGLFLGSLVVVGQASKSGGMQILTALVLMSDVLFKIVATAVTEAADYALHLRVRRAVDVSA